MSFTAEFAAQFMQRALKRELDRLTKPVTIIGDGSGVVGVQCSYCRVLSARFTAHCPSCGAPYTKHPENWPPMEQTPQVVEGEQ